MPSCPEDVREIRCSCVKFKKKENCRYHQQHENQILAAHLELSVLYPKQETNESSGLFTAISHRRNCLNHNSSSEGQPQSKLKLSGIECAGRLSKRWQRCRTRSESIIGNAKVGAVEQIEALRQDFQTDALGQVKAPG